MEIKNNTDISNIVASSISKLTLNSATRAFDSAKKSNNGQEIEQNESFSEDEVNVVDDNKISKNNINVEEIQKYASSIGEKLTVEEINYGLTYGRSVIADFSA